MARRFEAKAVWVTGAGQGIGRAIASRFVDEGASVVILERDAAAGRDAVDELSARGEVRLEVCDLADDEAVAEVTGRLAEQTPALHALINNAADQRSFGVPLEQLKLSDFRAALDANVTGALHLVQRALPLLRQGRGAIVQLSSTRALMSEPNTFPYSASKGAISALTHSLAVSLGPEVRVNGIAPGWVATEALLPRDRRHAPELSERDHAQHPAGRVGCPEDIAALAAFLCSDEAGFVTGQVWSVDGGMTRKMIYAE